MTPKPPAPSVPARPEGMLALIANNDEPGEYMIRAERVDRPGEGRWLTEEEAAFVVALCNNSDRLVGEAFQKGADFQRSLDEVAHNMVVAALQKLLAEASRAVEKARTVVGTTEEKP